MPDSNEKAIYYTLLSDTGYGDDFGNSVLDLHCFAVKLDLKTFCIVNMSSDGVLQLETVHSKQPHQKNTVGSC